MYTLTDAEMRDLGYTTDQIAQVRQSEATIQAEVDAHPGRLGPAQPPQYDPTIPPPRGSQLDLNRLLDQGE